MNPRPKPFYRIWLLALWAIFTVSLTVWWLIFGLRQLSLINEAGVQSSAELVRGHRMLLFEGATLVVSLIGGALSFYWLGLKERRQSDAIQRFLITFTHELKTPIASLRLQAESLAERLEGTAEKSLLDRLIADTSRLTLQLENSLFVASENVDQLITERIELAEIIESMRGEWPQLKIVLEGAAYLETDKRALQSILRNIFHNSVVHGKASQVDVEVGPSNFPACISLRFKDNGRGFQGDLDKAGNLFGRHYSGSGSGIGLYLINRLAKLLGGSGKTESADQGFCYLLELPGTLKT